MGVIKLKQDLQLAIANNVKDFKSDYKSLIFDNENREHIQTLYFIENLKVTVENNKLLYDVKMNEKVIKQLSSADIREIQQVSIKTRITNLFLEKMAKHNLLEIKVGKPQKTETKMTKLHEGQKIKMKAIQQILKEKFNIDAELKFSQVYLSLEANLPELNLNREMLQELESMFKELDVLAIVPHFNDENDNIQGVRIFMGISLN